MTADQATAATETEADDRSQMMIHYLDGICPPSVIG
jgi:hypothetical protein